MLMVSGKMGRGAHLLLTMGGETACPVEDTVGMRLGTVVIATSLCTTLICTTSLSCSAAFFLGEYSSSGLLALMKHGWFYCSLLSQIWLSCAAASQVF